MRSPGDVLLVDNYDSYTYNLAELVFEVLGVEARVVAVEAVEAGDLERARSVLISPGPGHPETEPALVRCMELVLAKDLPLLGVCLGHQAIVTAFGGEVGRTEPAHGQVARIEHKGDGILAGLSMPFNAVRYHSLVATRVPDVLVVDAVSEDGHVMAVRHRTRPIFGVQFHPESVLSQGGDQILRNFLVAA